MIRFIKSLLRGNDSSNRHTKKTSEAIERLANIQSALNEVKQSVDQLLANSARMEQQIDGVSNSLCNIPDLHGKLDLLLHRQTIPFPKNNILLLRNSFGFLAIPEDDIDAVAYYSGVVLPEPGTCQILSALLQPDSIFVDVGANIGAFTLLAGRKIDSSGHIWAIEPTPTLQVVLKHMIQINGLSNRVTLLEAAAGSSSGKGLLKLGKTSGHNSLIDLDEAVDSTETPIIVLDDVLASSKVDVIKIDVEGFELEVLAGLKNTIERNPRLSIILEFSPIHVARLGMDVPGWIAHLKEFGLKLFEIDEAKACLSELRSTEELESVFTLNLVMTNRDLSSLCE